APAVRGSTPLALEGTHLYLDRYRSEEIEVARALTRLTSEVAGIDSELLDRGLARLAPEASGERWALAIETAVRRRFAVVAGGPGTGKTTAVARILALIAEQRAAAGEPLPLVALAAPTGRAAARLQDAVQAEAEALAVGDDLRAWLGELRALTIHRLLGWRPQSTSRFRHDAERRLPHDVVIVDETSMVSLSLMARLIEAQRPGARLILIGDPAQLASIEAGAVLGDIVGTGDGEDGTGPSADTVHSHAAGIRRGIVVLDRGHRFGGEIARLATAIRAGDADGVIEILRTSAQGVRWLALDLSEPGSEVPAAIARPALAAARATIEAAREGRAPAALKALGAFRILCAHRRGPHGVSTWTERIESLLAAEIADLNPGAPWYVGRPLLVTQNDSELRLANGDTGVVIDVGDGRVACAFARGPETLLYGPSRLAAVQTVYAMTIHRSQGSQFDAAAVLLPEPGSRLLTRELLYTAATRAQRSLILAGSEEAVRAAVARPVARASGLGRRLRSGGD
ncbi:MAG: exodeoxyribonuclease V subunit alpha, partial [Solirubrobacteraceae bacterium]